MTRRRKKTDGQKIAERVYDYEIEKFVDYIDRLIRKRMAEAWAEGHEYGVIYGDLEANPYQGRKRK